MAKFVASRYFLQTDFLSAHLGTRPSFAWRSILFGRELLVKGLRREIGNGLNTNVWLHKWVHDPVEGFRAPWIKNYSFNVGLKVADDKSNY